MADLEGGWGLQPPSRSKIIGPRGNARRQASWQIGVHPTVWMEYIACMQWRIKGVRGLTPPPPFLSCQFENSDGPAFSRTLNPPLSRIPRSAPGPRSGVLNRGEISPMGEILGIQGGTESVWKLLSFQNWWHKMVPLLYFWRIYFSHSNTMPFNSRLAVIEINRCQWCHHYCHLKVCWAGEGGK